MGLLSRAAKMLVPGAAGAGVGYAVAPDDKRMEWAVAGGAGASMAPLLAKFIDPMQMGTFGGQFAKTANKPMLGLAREMEKVGASREAIWDNTGWFKGVDGKWRFEIDDSKSGISNGAMFEFYSSPVAKSGPANTVLEHADLFNAYPEIAANKTRFAQTPDKLSGSFNRANGDIDVSAPDSANLRSGLLHENQHAVQLQEEFARGGSPDRVNANLPLAPDMNILEQAHMIQYLAKNMGGVDEYFRKFPDALPDGTPYETAAVHLVRDPARLDYFDELLRLHQNPKETYRRLAGEVEARNVQTRRDFTPEQRKARPPWTTQDTPDNEQLIHMPSGLLSRYRP